MIQRTVAERAVGIWFHQDGSMYRVFYKGEKKTTQNPEEVFSVRGAASVYMLHKLWQQDV